ncbi:MAG TPA: SIS domain-containing protein [Rhabdochlamydiaceae bacterium]|jgi:D-sedoheptulose 7-phosphate isomerase
MHSEIKKAIDDALCAIHSLKEPHSLAFMETLSQWMCECFQNGNKLLIAGNGGSLCDAMHFAEELTGVFREKRSALPAIALSCPGHLTCTGNDLGFDEVFARGVEAFGRAGDLFIGLTTSGNSANLLKAFPKAKERGMRTVAFLGKTGGRLKGMSDLEWIVSGFRYSDRIQEAHMTAIHIVIEMLEKKLFPKENHVLNNLVSSQV